MRPASTSSCGAVAGADVVAAAFPSGLDADPFFPFFPALGFAALALAFALSLDFGFCALPALTSPAIAFVPATDPAVVADLAAVAGFAVAAGLAVTPVLVVPPDLAAVAGLVAVADRAPAAPAGIAVDMALAASVSDLTAASIALVAALTDCRAVVIVLAEDVACAAAVFSFAAAFVTRVAAEDTVRGAAAGFRAVADVAALPVLARVLFVATDLPLS
jgi:hypothetical protein